MTTAKEIINKAVSLINKVDAKISEDKERAACIRHANAGDKLSGRCKSLIGVKSDATVISPAYPKYNIYKDVYNKLKGREFKDLYGNKGYVINGLIEDKDVFYYMLHNKLIAKWNGTWFFTHNAIKSFESGQNSPVPPEQPKQPERPREPEPPVAQPPPQPPIVQPPTVQEPSEGREDERLPPTELSFNTNREDIRRAAEEELRRNANVSRNITYFSRVMEANGWDFTYHDDGYISLDVDEEDRDKHYETFRKMNLIDVNGYITRTGTAIIHTYKEYIKRKMLKKAGIERRIEQKIQYTPRYNKKQLLESKGYSGYEGINDIYSASRYLRNNIPHLSADYSIFDIRVANSCNRALSETNALMPEVVKRLGLLGHSHYVNKKLGVRTTSSAIARAFPPSAFRTGAISWNSRICNNHRRLENICQSCVNSGFHPDGTENIDSIMHHELGHNIDYLLGLRNDPEVLSLYGSLLKDEVAFGVSGYAAAKGISEFIAEAWAEYMTNPNPRVIAQKLGDMIVDKYKQKYGP